MKCLYCGSDQSKVVDKRSVATTSEIRRRRECLKCHKRYTTYERVCALEYFVIKRDGRREPFNREKLKAGVERALEKRPGVERLEEIIDRIENRLKNRGRQDIESKLIGKTVLIFLKRIDKVAYMRFASVYRHFENPDDFAKELQSLTS